MQAQEMLLSQLSDPGARAKISSKFGNFVKDRMREASFVEVIQPSEPVDRTQCQVSTEHDGLAKVVELAPQSRATIITFKGNPRANYLRARRILVPFITIMSDMFQKTEQEFLAYSYPLGKVVEDQAVKDLQEVKDREYLIHAEAAVQTMQTEANGGSVTSLTATAVTAGSVVQTSAIKGELAVAAGANTATVHPVQKRDLIKLANLIDGRRLETALFLMTQVDWNNTQSWTIEDVGSPMLSEIMKDGYKGNTLLGKRYARTIKTDILRPGNIYAFTAPDYLGRHYILNNVKFYIDKVINLVKFVAWMDVSLCLANIASVAKLETYGGDATANDANSILASVSPKDLEQLGAENNRVASRKFFPNIVTF